METWRHIPEIKSHCAVEMTLDRCVQRLRKRLLMESHVRNRQMLNSMHIGHNDGDNHNKPLGLGNKLPSFYTSPSLVNLSGLAVSDQPISMSTNPTGATGGSSSNHSMFKGEGWDSVGLQYDYDLYEDAVMHLDSDDPDSSVEGGQQSGGGRMMSR